MLYNRQIKGLSTFFLSDEGRYKFFDASFVSVADVSQYSTLQSEFIDPAFLTVSRQCFNSKNNFKKSA